MNSKPTIELEPGMWAPPGPYDYSQFERNKTERIKGLCSTIASMSATVASLPASTNNYDGPTEQSRMLGNIEGLIIDLRNQLAEKYEGNQFNIKDP
jgi:hypothetical protein